MSEEMMSEVMGETGVYTPTEDEGEITREPSTKEVEDNEEQAAECDYLAQVSAALMRRAWSEGDTVAFILVNPELAEGFAAAFGALPEQSIPTEVKANCPLQVDAQVEKVQVVRGTDLELRFLETYFGPVEMGGTGFLPRLQHHLQSNPFPLQITLETLRTLYILEIKNRISGPQLITPGNMDLQNLPLIRR